MHVAMLGVRCLAAASACPPIEMESEWTLVPFFTFHFTRERDEWPITHQPWRTGQGKEKHRAGLATVDCLDASMLSEPQQIQRLGWTAQASNVRS